MQTLVIGSICFWPKVLAFTLYNVTVCVCVCVCVCVLWEEIGLNSFEVSL